MQGSQTWGLQSSWRQALETPDSFLHLPSNARARAARGERKHGHELCLAVTGPRTRGEQSRGVSFPSGIEPSRANPYDPESSSFRMDAVPKGDMC